MEVEHISLHGYIRNTASDTEVYAEHQLRVTDSSLVLLLCVLASNVHNYQS